MNPEGLTKQEIAFKIKVLEEGIYKCKMRSNDDLCKNREERVKVLKSYLGIK